MVQSSKEWLRSNKEMQHSNEDAIEANKAMNGTARWNRGQDIMVRAGALHRLRLS